ncbi:4'-phosphopantetheinyl transferase [Glarea lozoyensis ATCC 20868]|uniref:holo-[acyl-carrier-protein] synthase n=1 Tax=Glarea lozoyensis (strain ATCC 20868 / MF5171) TaxID=1116229 RepID=S3DIU2_GLAL2|nr:4'-phosphopantetheinyl transferase [Glarea lozoyensis ATCC 20868]EPE31951.1 4'-phosphopantetheinyl transferase [Glarea lozoyensis ATCC 20868]
MENNSPKIIQWILDTRPLWPVPAKEKKQDEVAELKTVASRALALLSDSEQASVLKYYHVRDAKMSLASHLLKHLVISKYCNVPWSKAMVSRTSNGKPCYVPPAKIPSMGSHVMFDFNVSHQAGIVSLIAAVGFKNQVDTGTDVVCVNERESRDSEYIQKSGFFDWVDIHGEVFSESEISFMKLGPILPSDLGIEGEFMGYGKDRISRCQRRGGEVAVNVKRGDHEEEVNVKTSKVIDVKMRRFYAMWCLRESFVKMTGEALLAPWLKELEILDVQAPTVKEGHLTKESLEQGGVQHEFRIIFKGKPVTDVRMELSALGEAFMVGGALRARDPDERNAAVMGSWQELDLEEDILKPAESNP